MHIVNVSTVGANIARLRHARGMTLHAVALVAHISPSALSDIEHSRTKHPSAETLQGIAKAFDVTTMFLQDFDGAGDKAVGESLAAMTALHGQMPALVREQWLRMGRDLLMFWRAAKKA
jgi:transcriptional regulator with XRE-family HTH domain